MVRKRYLLTPGPTPVPERIAKAMSQPIIHHRTAEYKDVVKTANENLKHLFKTKNNVLTFTASGTGAMEAAVVNTLSKGDTAIVVRGGKFGERFAEICSSYGVTVVPLDIEWGTRPEPPIIEKAIKENAEAKAVFLQLCETSTATAYDIESIANVVKKTDAILVVDAISGLGADKLDMDNWGVDIAIGGSQKAFMLPPGLSFCAISKKAWSLIKKANLPKFYYDFNKYQKLVERFDSPFTPAITLVIGLKEALLAIMEEGVDAFIERHKRDAEFVRKSVKGLGLSLFSKFPSDAVTAVNIPEGVDGGKLISLLESQGITLAGGQAQLKGKIFRIAHMGGITRKDLEFALKKIKETLGEQKWR